MNQNVSVDLQKGFRQEIQKADQIAAILCLVQEVLNYSDDERLFPAISLLVELMDAHTQNLAALIGRLEANK